MESISPLDTKTPLSVLFAIKNADLRSSLISKLKSESNGSLQIVGEVGDPSEAAVLLKRHKTDVLVVDLGIRGKGFVAKLKEKQPALRVVMVVHLNGQGSLVDIVRYQADAYVHHDDPVNEYLDACRADVGPISFSRKVLEDLRVRLSSGSTSQTTNVANRKLNLLDVIRLAEEFFAGLPSPNQHWPEDVQEGYSFLNRNLSDSDLMPCDVRKHCGILTVPPFDTAFKRCTGFTIRGYITEYRLQAARMLLSRRTPKCMDVVSAVGYPSAASFTMAFKVRFGCSPVDYKSGRLLEN